MLSQLRLTFVWQVLSRLVLSTGVLSTLVLFALYIQIEQKYVSRKCQWCIRALDDQLRPLGKSLS